MILCPKCSSKLVKKMNSFVCDLNHCYDISKQGYVNLCLNGKISGDSKEMVLARHEFLSHGYYACLRDKLVEIMQMIQPIDLLDLGCGEGYYTSKMSVYALNCVGVDLSKDALKIASREDKKSQYIIASIFHLPIDSVDCITNIFAPTPIDEIKRILKPKGIYIRVNPHTRHLYEFKKVLYEEVYENEIEIIQDEKICLLKQIQVNDTITINNNQDIQSLFMMTPYYWKSSKDVSNKVNQMKELSTTISFDIQIYQKRS
ncbi:MAG: methyltransferase domain-containing protein [Traorella sp.]